MPTVRISKDIQETIRTLAKQMGLPMSKVLKTAVEEYRRLKFLEECNQAYIRLKSDPESFAEELAEREEWDVTLNDGLE
jgi:antitoxin component of RelBE/YafQ-DinJ toxin-antitoxin module